MEKKLYQSINAAIKNGAQTSAPFIVLQLLKSLLQAKIKPSEEKLCVVDFIFLLNTKPNPMELYTPPHEAQHCACNNYAKQIYSQQILTKTIASLCFDIKNSRRYTNKNKASFVQHKNITLEPQKLLLKNLRIKTTKLWTKPISFKILKRLTTAM